MSIITILVCLLGIFLLAAMMLLFFAIRVVPNDSRLTVYRLGENIGDKGPGIVFLIPFIDKGVLRKLDEPSVHTDKA